MEIEEYIELIKELLTILQEQDKIAFTDTMKNMTLIKVKDLSSSIIKGILFKYYTLINDKLTIILINVLRSTYKKLMQKFPRRVISYVRGS